MVSRTRLFAYACFLCTLLAVPACGGGGSSSPSPISTTTMQAPATATARVQITPSPTPTPSPSPTPVVIFGKATDLISGSPLPGFIVSVGATPDSNGCIAAQTASAQPCGVAASPLPTGTTLADGTFAVAAPRAGTYMLTLSKDSTYATLHRTIVANGSSLGTLSVTALSADEQSWLIDVNSKRAMVSFSASYPNLVVDEYAEEQARAEVAAIVAGSQPYGDSTEGYFGNQLAQEPGDIYGGGRGVSDLVNAAGAYLQADTNWMNVEKPNCPNGDWLTCSFSATTGHYINISAMDDVWVGMGESATSFNYQAYGAEWAYAMLMPANVTPNDPDPTRLPRRH